MKKKTNIAGTKLGRNSGRAANEMLQRHQSWTRGSEVIISVVRSSLINYYSFFCKLEILCKTWSYFQTFSTIRPNFIIIFHFPNFILEHFLSYELLTDELWFIHTTRCSSIYRFWYFLLVLYLFLTLPLDSKSGLDESICENSFFIN